MNESNLISFQIFSIYFSLYAVIALSSGKLVAIAWCEQNQWISCKNLHLRSKGTHSLSISHWEALNKRNWNSHNLCSTVKPAKYPNGTQKASIKWFVGGYIEQWYFWMFQFDDIATHFMRWSGLNWDSFEKLFPMVKLFRVSLDCGLKLKLFSNVSYFFFQRLRFIEMVESQKDSLHREKKPKQEILIRCGRKICAWISKYFLQLRILWENFSIFSRFFPQQIKWFSLCVWNTICRSIEWGWAGKKELRKRSKSIIWYFR